MQRHQSTSENNRKRKCSVQIITDQFNKCYIDTCSYGFSTSIHTIVHSVKQGPTIQPDKQKQFIRACPGYQCRICLKIVYKSFTSKYRSINLTVYKYSKVYDQLTHQTIDTGILMEHCLVYGQKLNFSQSLQKQLSMSTYKLFIFAFINHINIVGQ